jgi:hypothetical protein
MTLLLSFIEVVRVISFTAEPNDFQPVYADINTIV